MMKFGTTTNPMKDVLKEISEVAKHKFDFVEISIEPEVLFSNEITVQKNRIKKILKKGNMFATVHAPWNSELGNTYEEIREGWFDICKDIIDSTKLIGIKKFNVHLYSQQDLRKQKIKKEVIKNNIQILKRLVNYGKKRNVEIVLEIMPGKNQIHEFSDIKKILDSVKGIGLNFDSGHCFINGRMSYIKKFLSTFKSRITHVHLHDNHGLNDEHFPLRKGLVNFKYIANFLKQMNYSGTVTFETFHGGNEKINAVKSREYFKRLMRS